jgi:hypothetical protein
MKQGGSFKRQSLISAPGRVEQAKSTSLHHSAYEYSGGDAYRNCRFNCLDRVPLQALDCVRFLHFYGADQSTAA